MGMDFPFTYGRIVTRSQFLGRKKELSKLKKNIERRIHTILISPRRWGKSSLIKQLSLKHAKENQMRFVFIDLLKITDDLEFYEAYCKAVLKAESPELSERENLIKKFFKSTNPILTLKNSGNSEFNISFRQDELEENYEEILDFPERLSKKRNRKFIICVDEVQNLQRFKNSDLFQSILSSVWQRQKNVVYILCGSKRQLMYNIFNSQNGPFFRFGEILNLQKIKKKHFIRHITSTFEKSGKTIPRERVETMIKLADRNPYFIQQLARNVWVKSSEMVVESDLNSAVEEILNQNSVWYIREVERMTPPQFNYLKAVANEEKTLSGQDVIRKYKLGSSANVVKIKNALEEREILDYWNPYPEFNDPFFKLWIQRYAL
jgi:hypothetical protein